MNGSGSRLAFAAALLFSPGFVAAMQPCSSIRLLPPQDIFTLSSANTVVRVADFTGDGRPDILVLDPAIGGPVGSSGRIHLEVQQSDGRFLATPTLAVSANALDLGAADVDGDGRIDAILLRSDGLQLIRVGTNGLLELGPAPAPGGLGVGLGAGTPTAFADIDRDGRAELLAAVSGSLVAFELKTSLAFEATFLMPLSNAALRLVSGDFNGDGNIDVLVIGPEDYPTFRPFSPLLFGDGHGRFSLGPSFRFPSIKSLAIGDFDGDGRTDFVYSGLATSATSHHVVSALVKGDQALGLVSSTAPVTSPSSAVITGSPGDSLVAADLDGDGALDFAVSQSGGGVQPFLGLGTGTFSPRNGTRTPVGSVFDARDMDGDGRPDLLSLLGHLFVTRSVCAPTLPDRVVPALISVAGANGVRYETELTLDNAYPAELLLELRYVPTFGGGGGTTTLSLSGGRQLSLRPAMAALAALGLPIPATGDRGGTLGIRILWGSMTYFAVTARVTSETPGGHGGVAFEDVSSGQGFSDATLVGWLRDTEGDRSNVALVNLGGEDEGAVTLRPVVVSTDAARPGSVTLPDVRLAPGETLQLNRILRLAGGPRTGFVRVERASGSAPFYAYGVVNDEGSGDGSFVRGFETTRRAASRFTIPAIVETGGYTTDLVVTNTTGETRTVAFRFVADELTTPDRTARFTFDVPANGQLFIPDLINSLRQQAIPGVGPGGIPYVGALFAEVSGPATSGLFLGVRVSAQKPEGRHGVFYEALPDEELSTVQCRVSGVRQDSQVRTNVAIVNTGDFPATFVVTAVEPNRFFTAGKPKTLVLEPGQWTQIDAALLALESGLTDGRINVMVANNGAASFLAYGITNDGATPGAGTDDGSYLPMTKIR